MLDEDDLFIQTTLSLSLSAQDKRGRVYISLAFRFNSVGVTRSDPLSSRVQFWIEIVALAVLDAPKILQLDLTVFCSNNSISKEEDRRATPFKTLIQNLSVSSSSW